MRRLLTSRVTPAVIAGALMAIVACGGYALANGGGTITACVSHNGGALYKAGKCRKHDSRLSWNERGPRGATGPAGPIKLTTVDSGGLLNPAGDQTGGTVDCPTGEYATGGGISGSTTTQSANASYPHFDTAGHATGWSAYMNNTGTANATFHVYVICAPAASVSP